MNANDFTNTRPEDAWKLIREGTIDFPTAGMCAGYAQANLVILPKQYADYTEVETMPKKSLKYSKSNGFPLKLSA